MNRNKKSFGENLDDKLDQDYRAKNPSNIKEWLFNMLLMDNFFKKYMF